MKIILDDKSFERSTIFESNGKYYYVDTTALPEFMCYNGPQFETGIFAVNLPKEMEDKIDTLKMLDFSDFVDWEGIENILSDSWEEALENHESVINNIEEIIKNIEKEEF